MTRIRRANGQGWEADPRPLPGHFQRADGSVMTDAEITAATKTIMPQEASRVTMARIAHERAELASQREKEASTYSDRAWEAVERLGTQVAAAKELGVSQAAVQRGLDRYMEQHGIEGPRPGLLAPGAPAVVERTRPFVEARSRAIEEARPEPVPARAAAPEPAPTPDDSESLVISLLERDVPLALVGLIEWLIEHGPTWTNNQAAYWRLAFEATVKLIYPAREVAP
jgi:hypothetical protein